MKNPVLICMFALIGASFAASAQDAPKKPREKIEIIAEMRAAIEKSQGVEKHENMKSLAFYLLNADSPNALDREEAKKLLKNAADEGYIPAMADYGMGMWAGDMSGGGSERHMYNRNITPEERAEGFKYTKMSAERGNANAMAFLYHIYTTPPSPLNNYEAALTDYFSPQKAFKLLEKNLDSMDDFYVLPYAQHLMTGYGCEKDPAKAANALENAKLKSDDFYLPYIKAQIDARIFYIYEYMLRDEAKAYKAEKRLVESSKGPLAAATFLGGEAGMGSDVVFNPRNPNTLIPDYQKAREFYEILKKSEEYKNFPRDKNEPLTDEEIRNVCIKKQGAWDQDFYITKRLAEEKMTFGGKDAKETTGAITEDELEETLKKADGGDAAAQFKVYVFGRDECAIENTSPPLMELMNVLALKCLYDSAFQCYRPAMMEAAKITSAETGTQSKYPMPTVQSDAAKFWLKKLAENFPGEGYEQGLEKLLEKYPDPGVDIF